MKYNQLKNQLDFLHLDLIGPIKELSIGKAKTSSKNNEIFTPEELFSNRKPTVSHLKIFGCHAEIFIPKHKRSKLECTTQSGIFVGYSSKRKAYRICDPKDFSITESRDVKFLEDKKGAALLDNDNTTKTQDYSLIEIFENENNEEPIFDNEDKDPIYKPDEESFKVSHGDLIPSSYEETIFNPESTLWRQAMNNEIHYLKDHHVWNLIELLQARCSIITVTVMKTDSFRTLLAYATIMDYEYHHFDVETAFLYGKLTETIYMNQPEGYQRQGKDIVCSKLNQALYGLKQSGRIDVTEPQSFEEAVQSPEAVYWRKQWTIAYSASGTRHLGVIIITATMKPNSRRWVYKLKTNESGNVESFKARLVARGFSQKEGIDYQERYALDINLAVIRASITLSLNLKWYNRQFDVDNAYLYGNLEYTDIHAFARRSREER
ncbi:hypothetical protein LAZ67_5002644 [Cordylochernes scorpioides]|uniref:Reverse transcriptase Ty1/copia-type domain-containing protein n=1 Tax=Cordylochernes scorpioides TaxID=51811 RepID=A0ABY6KGK7_9ARAC|nr:hypothetical protein LAZ67_5002644 [Cordylochernes scorpioides]